MPEVGVLRLFAEINTYIQAFPHDLYNALGISVFNLPYSGAKQHEKQSNIGTKHSPRGDFLASVGSFADLPTRRFFFYYF